jgi:hypothetical protein
MATSSKSNGKNVHRGFVVKNYDKTRYWISFDLGLMSDYSPFYIWLDSMGAEECGFGMATLTTNKTRDQLAAEMKRILKGIPSARVYIVSRQHGGRFIAGGRKAAPWSGFAVSSATMADEA